MKPMLKLLICAVLALAMLAGCAPAPAKMVGSAEFMASDNVYTYKRLAPDKTTLIVSRTGNIYLDDLCNAFEVANPDVQVVQIDITGGSDSYSPMAEWVENNCAPDVMFMAGSVGSFAKYFEDISAKPFVNNFETESLNRIAMDGHIYALPGPSQVKCLVYNKTMFEQYGWELPKTFDEFVALCVKIREDTNGAVEPWNPNAKYSDEILGAMEGFTYGELFAGVENRTWYNDYCAGTPNFSEHMAPFFETYQKLLDAGLIREEHFSYSATTRGKEFKEGKIAIINVLAADMLGGDEMETGFMPFPGKTEDDGYVIDVLSCSAGIPINDARDPKVQDAAERFLDYYSTPGAQNVFIGEQFMISHVKDAPSPAYEKMSELHPYIEAGNVFEKLNFPSWTYLGFLDILKGEANAEDCMRKTDEAAKSGQKPASEEPTPVGVTATEDFTILEVSNYIADMYRERTGADIGLIANNLAYRGNLMRIFAGDLTELQIKVLKPRSFENGSTLVKLSMTGRQILDAMNAPPDIKGVFANCFYAFSGLKCRVAPWNSLGEKYLSVTLADGSKLDENKLYTVGAWQGTISDEYITETLATYDGSFEEHLTAKLNASGGTIAPVDDGRITLVWN